MSSEGRGRLFILSAPSGTGKATLAHRLVDEVPRLILSRSYTSRAMRPGETDGVDYTFISMDRFEAMVASGEFLEWARVFGALYGTGRADTERHLAGGDDVLLVMDVQGARSVRASGVASIGIYVLPPSIKVLGQRLRDRPRETEEEARHREAVAREDVAALPEYDYVVVNGERAQCVAGLRAIVLGERESGQSR